MALMLPASLRNRRIPALVGAIVAAFVTGLGTTAHGHGLGISAHQVHRLLEETTKTFYEHLLERRLMHAHELLTRAGSAKIVAIAEQSGFSDITHFNHAFRARFGDTPTGVRSAAETDRALYVLQRTIVDR